MADDVASAHDVKPSSVARMRAATSAAVAITVSTGCADSCPGWSEASATWTFDVPATRASAEHAQLPTAHVPAQWLPWRCEWSHDATSAAT